MKKGTTDHSDIEPGKGRFNSLRWQVSTLLLLSSLTAVALASLTILLATALAAGPTLNMIGEVGTINTVLDDVQDRLLHTDSLPSPAEKEEIRKKLNLVDKQMAAMGDLMSDSIPEVARYRDQVFNWLKRDGPMDEVERKKAAVPLLDAHRRVQAALLYSAYGSRPAWVDWLLPMIPGGLAWILLMAGLSVYRAYRMRGQLSLPLQILANAAQQVRAGTLDSKLPQVRGVFEVTQLRESMETMREGLVSSISSLDSRNEELSTILDNMNDGVLLVSGVGRVQELNPSVHSLWDRGGSRGERPREGLLLGDVFPQFPKDIISGVEATTNEVVMDPSATPPSIFEVSSNPIKGAESDGKTKGKPNGHVLVINDVTAAREVEKLKLHFLSMVTHELKTPLTSVLGYTKVMLMGKGGDLSDRQRGYISVIDEQASQLRAMIQDMLDMTRLEVGSLSIEAAPIRVADMLASIYSTQMAAAKVVGIEFGMVPGEVTSEEVLGDSMRLSQVLGNLVGNALKFTPKGGKITLLAGKEGRFVWFAVEDTGRGIPQTAIPHLFEKFYQVERGDTRKSGGAGLGLFICRELIKQMGGRIEVKSKQGEGSRFTVYLPLYQPTLNQSEQAK